MMPYFVRQFGMPRGLLGWLAGQIMAHRRSNLARNRWTVDRLDIRDGQRILEVGFGPGLAIQGIVRRYPNCQIAGIDHSRVMVDMAARRNRDAVSTGQVRLFCGDIDSAMLCGPYDRIFALNSHMFWSDLEGTVRKLASFLAPGGMLAITYQPRGQGASDDRALSEAMVLTKVMAAANLNDIVIEHLELSPLAVCAHGRKL